MRSESFDSLDFTEEAGIDELADAALCAARRSYAPFGAPSGMAVRTSGGQVFAGFVIQSAAHNPGMTTAGPLQGLLVKLAASGCRDFSHITEAVLVETVDYEVRRALDLYTYEHQMTRVHDYEHHVRRALDFLAPHASLHTILVTMSHRRGH